MKDLSIIMPVLDEKLSVLEHTLTPILTEIEGKNVEIIIIDNSKYQKITWDHQSIRHIRNGRNPGVGASFNQGVELADSENLVLMGCDVVTLPGWYDRVRITLFDNPPTIFNAACSGYNDDDPPFHKDKIIRYGAELLYTVGRSDLPDDSISKHDKKFSKILQGRWIDSDPDPDNDLTPIGCLMGAFYWMHKSDFVRLRGWNGHRQWGSLEPFLSIKARAHGMKILLDKKIEVSHYFGRDVMRANRQDFAFFNMLFIARTMFSPALADELEYFLRYGGRDELIEKLQVNNARKMLKRVHGLVSDERDYNQRHFDGGLIANIDQFKNRNKKQ